MSADNYEVIRKVPGQSGRYFVTCEFPSCEWPSDEESWSNRRILAKRDNPHAEPESYTLEQALRLLGILRVRRDVNFETKKGT